MLSKNTIQLVKSFCKPGVDTGVIPHDEFKELLTLARQENCQENQPRHYLTTNEVAERLHCSTKTVHRMREAGKIRGVFLTDSKKSLRIPEDELELLGKGADHE